MLNRKLLLPIYGALIVLVSIDAASAAMRSAVFTGTRAQVRAACARIGGGLFEGTDKDGIGISVCVGASAGVTCGDDNICHGTYSARISALGPTPAKRGGFGSAVAGVTVKQAPPAQSLSSTAHDPGSVAVPSAPPAPPAPTDSSGDTGNGGGGNDDWTF